MVSFMPVCDKLSAVFIHIPKAGGSSFENSLQMNRQLFSTSPRDRIESHFNALSAPQHVKGSTIKKLIGADKYKNYFKFSIVRNPWDRLVSEFFWRQGGGKRDAQNRIRICLNRGAYNEWGKVEDYEYKSFEDFVTLVCGKLVSEDAVRVEGWDAHLESQSGFFDAEVDFIGRFEHMTACWRTVCRKLGKGDNVGVLKKSNSSVHEHYTKYYTTKMVDMVGERYERDVKKFSYEFGGEE